MLWRRGILELGYSGTQVGYSMKWIIEISTLFFGYYLSTHPSIFVLVYKLKLL